MPTIKPAHYVEVDLKEYVEEDILSHQRAVDTCSLLGEMLHDQDLTALAIGCNYIDFTLFFVYPSQAEAIAAEDRLDEWLTELGNGLQAGYDAIKKAVRENAEKRGGKSPYTPGSGKRPLGKQGDWKGKSK